MTISNYDDIIDSRDIIERIEELQEERDAYDTDANRSGAWSINNPEDAEELDALKALQEDAEGYAPDWHYGATLIHEDYFAEYCEELCKDIGSIPADCPDYIRDNIDWEGVANDLMVDYTKVEFDGVTYYVW